MRRPRLAIDLEFTLVSNAVSQIARPGLRRFLRFCSSAFEPTIFTCVREPITRQVLVNLVSFGEIDPVHGDLPILWKYPWDLYKDLSRVPGEGPCYLIDDCEMYVQPGQEPWWIPIEPFDPRAHPHDQELLRIEEVLKGLLLAV